MQDEGRGRIGGAGAGRGFWRRGRWLVCYSAAGVNRTFGGLGEFGGCGTSDRGVARGMVGDHFFVAQLLI